MCSAQQYLALDAQTALSRPTADAQQPAWSLQRPAPAARCSAFHHSKYLCRDHIFSLRWRPQVGCEAPPKLISALARGLPGSTLFIMGDSLAYEIFLEAACHLEQEHELQIEQEHELSKSTNRSSSKSTKGKPPVWRAAPWAWARSASERGRFFGCVSYQYAGTHLRLCYVPTGLGRAGWHADPAKSGRGKESIAQAIEYMASANLTRKDDAILAIEHPPVATYELTSLHRAQMLVRLAATGATTLRNETGGSESAALPLTRSRLPHLMWMCEGVAAHFKTASGEYDPEHNQSSAREDAACGALPLNASKPLVVRKVDAVLRACAYKEGATDSTPTSIGRHAQLRSLPPPPPPLSPPPPASSPPTTSVAAEPRRSDHDTAASDLKGQLEAQLRDNLKAKAQLRDNLKAQRELQLVEASIRERISLLTLAVAACRAKDESSPESSLRGSAARENEPRIALQVLDTWTLTRSLHAFHPGVHKAVSGSADHDVLDCLHTCTNGGVNGAILDAISSDLLARAYTWR